jgi:predicted RNA binding protein YcfA (HicA-like mRNA interferase family)
MPKIPRISAKELLKALGKLGFSVIRLKGSHHYVSHEDGRATVVPRFMVVKTLELVC